MAPVDAKRQATASCSTDHAIASVMPSTKRKADNATSSGVTAVAPPRRVFCDLDGVLCDFERGVVRVCGAEPSALQASLASKAEAEDLEAGMEAQEQRA